MDNIKANTGVAELLSYGKTQPAESGSRSDKPASKAGRKGFDPAVRETVLETTRQAMEARGLEGVKARLIAQRAGISVGSIYNLFGDLDDLIRVVNGETYDELMAIENRALEIARSERRSALDQLLALAKAYLEFVERHQSRWLATLAFNRSQTELPPCWYLEKEQALFCIIEEALKAFPGAQDPEIRRQHARALWASVHGIVTIAVADGFLMQPIDNVWTQICIIVEAVARKLEERD